jgi:hypothetical protein
MAERVAYDPRATCDGVLKASTRITQATTAFLKVLQVGELEERTRRLHVALTALIDIGAAPDAEKVQGVQCAAGYVGVRADRGGDYRSDAILPCRLHGH